MRISLSSCIEYFTCYFISKKIFIYYPIIPNHIYSNNCVNLKYSDYILFILAKTQKKQKIIY